MPIIISLVPKLFFFLPSIKVSFCFLFFSLTSEIFSTVLLNFEKNQFFCFFLLFLVSKCLLYREHILRMHSVSVLEKRLFY